jgi:hypothetical protein
MGEFAALDSDEYRVRIVGLGSHLRFSPNANLRRRRGSWRPPSVCSWERGFYGVGLEQVAKDSGISRQAPIDADRVLDMDWAATSRTQPLSLAATAADRLRHG